MDLLKDLIKISNELLIQELSENMDEENYQLFHSEFIKQNNILFTISREYKIDTYGKKVDAFNKQKKDIQLNSIRNNANGAPQPLIVGNCKD